MTPAYVNSLDFSFFSDTKQQLNTMIAHLSSRSPLTQEHGAIEQYICHEGHELLRRLQAHLKLRSLKSSGDFDKYWDFHKQQSKKRLYTIKSLSSA